MTASSIVDTWIAVGEPPFIFHTVKPPLVGFSRRAVCLPSRSHRLRQAPGLPLRARVSDPLGKDTTPATIVATASWIGKKTALPLTVLQRELAPAGANDAHRRT